jgi:S-adenosylmethionine:tRNA ribosyltransferase-isomerase
MRSAASSLAGPLATELEAHEPPEARGLARDAVRLLVATRSDGHITHARFRDLPELLAPGDLLVVNTSATLPAAIGATDAGGRAVELRFATRAPDRDAAWWVVELRTPDGSAPLRGDHAGALLGLAGGAYVRVCAPYAASARLWLARYDGELPVADHLARHGHPIRYGYVHGHWPLADYQTAYALDPGSAEMPSAGRPFTPELITRLVASGVLVAPVTLHTGVSSLERHEEPYPEPYEVPPATARLVNAVRAWGGHVVAVGTTVVRALETVADASGVVRAGAGWTRLVVTPERGLRAVDGLLTGWHEPEASHLRMLEAAAGRDLLERSYAAARASGYLWHEFGDSHLILP